MSSVSVSMQCSLATTDTYPIVGHRMITALSLEAIIKLSHENIIESFRENEERLLQKYFEILNRVIENIHEAAMEHYDEQVRSDFIYYRLQQSKRSTLYQLTEYLVDKQVVKVLRRTSVGSKIAIVRQSLENSIRPILESAIEKQLIIFHLNE
jgi:DNA primase large subunit